MANRRGCLASNVLVTEYRAVNMPVFRLAVKWALADGDKSSQHCDKLTGSRYFRMRQSARVSVTPQAGAKISATGTGHAICNGRAQEKIETTCREDSQ